MLLQIQNGSLSAGGQTILSHFDFEIRGNEKLALVGRNGAGKTTFLRLLAGELSLDRDDQNQACALRTSRKLTIGLLSQQPFTDDSLTVEEAILKACPCPDKWDRERFSWEQEYDRIFTGFGLKKEDKKKKLSCFSGGEKTKIALIRLLLLKPDILLLDEPTNHLDLQTVEWLEACLQAYEHAVVVVSHDRFFLDQTVSAVWELQEQRLTRYAGNYTAYRKQKIKNTALQEKAFLRQQEEIARLEALIERFKHKPKKAAFARSRKKILERMPKVEKPRADEAHMFAGELSPRIVSSKWALQAERLKIGYEKPLLELSVRIRRGQKIGVIGSNGAGKSTFLKTVAGLLPPLGGKCELGLNVEIGYFDQLSAALSSGQTVAEHFHSRFPALTEKEARGALGAFLFPGKEASKKVSQLSGGEKSRLLLAELLTSRPNFLLLDEPTNHMDIPARETLESALRAYQGTLLFVSHDRYFIKQTAQSLLIFEGDEALYYPFDYSHYIERCRNTAPGEDPSARIRAEDQALLASLQKVPKAERHRLREISTEHAYEDWQLRLSLEPLLEARQAMEAFLEASDPEREWLDPDFSRERTRQEEALLSALTQACLEWYGKWSEFHPEPENP